MKLRLGLVALLLASASLFAAVPASRPLPRPLADQVGRLAELLRDSHASEYAEARMFQVIRRERSEDLVLVVFSLEGYGGGNSYTQFLAAFEADTGDPKKPHFTLLDVIAIGGRGVRTVQALNARTSANPRNTEMAFALDVLENTDSDAPNFPSRKAVLNVLLRDGRLTLRKP